MAEKAIKDGVAGAMKRGPGGRRSGGGFTGYGLTPLEPNQDEEKPNQPKN